MLFLTNVMSSRPRVSLKFKAQSSPSGVPCSEQPQEGARPLDQGQSEACTAHAVTNACCEALMRQGIDISLDRFLQSLVHLSTADLENGNWPLELDNVTLPDLMDQNTGKWGSVHITVNSLKSSERQMVNAQFVLVYDRVPGDVNTRHCVFIHRVGKNEHTKKPETYICFNSWGTQTEHDPTLVVAANQPGNMVSQVIATWKPKNETPQRRCNKIQMAYTIAFWMFSVLFLVLRYTNITPLDPFPFGQICKTFLIVIFILGLFLCYMFTLRSSQYCNKTPTETMSCISFCKATEPIQKCWV